MPIIAGAAAPRRRARTLERRGGVAAVHRDGQRALGVLVDEQLARRHVGEGVRVGGQRRARPAPRPPPARRASGRCRRAARGPRRATRCRSGRITSACATSAPRPRARLGAAPAARSSSGSSGSPASASSAPAARWAATGANTSRPWKVADTGSSRCGERVTSTASATPPQRSQARLSSPLSGPTSMRPSPAAQRHARGARCPPAGPPPPRARPPACTAACCAARSRRGARRSGVIPWVTSTISALGWIERITPWQTPTNSSSRP